MRIAIVLTVLAVAALAASSAQASGGPDWYECAKVAGGTLEKGCAREGGKGGYEIREGVGKGKSFKGKGREPVLHTVVPGKGDMQVTCTSVKVIGAPAAPDREVHVVETFTGCELNEAPCQSGASSGKIVSDRLAGHLGWLSREASSAGVALSDEAEPGVGYIESFECTGVAKVRVHGATIASISPAEALTKVTTVSFAVGPYLGEVSPGYTPLTNPPGFEEEEAGVLRTELNDVESGGAWEPEGGLPAGQQYSMLAKGETLEIR